MSIEVPQSRIDALVRLLGDDDPKICSVAWENLEKIGMPALSAIEKASRDTDDARVRAQSQKFLKEWSRREVFRRWVAFCRRGDVDLEEGVFLIAETEYPNTDMASYASRLDGFAAALQARLATARTIDDAVRRISALLFGEYGLKGNAAEYYDPDNSYLNRVLDRKKGIPISLAAIFLLVARRVSVLIHAVGMPHHFLLKYQSGGEDVFVDAFHGGKLLSASDCVQLLAETQTPFYDEYLKGVSDRQILARMLGNLLRIYLESEDQRRYERVSAMLKLLT